MKIEICMGSSCHVKGSKTVLELLRSQIKEHKLESKVQLAGSVCLGQCKSEGTNMKIDGEIVTGINAGNFSEFFKSRVLSPLGI